MVKQKGMKQKELLKEWKKQEIWTEGDSKKNGRNRRV